MPGVAEQPIKPRRGMLGFYVASFTLVALAVFGAWFWNAWTNWQFGEFEAQRRQSEAARQLGVPVETAVDLGGGVALDLVLIPAGMFDMGSLDSNAGGVIWEGPVHRVQISRAFYMGKYEVTQEQWQKVMGANPSYFKGPKLPVEQVSWDDCQEFLKKLNALPRPVPLPLGEGSRVRGQFRLPTEAEWEWACRAGTRTLFCFGDDGAQLGDYAWYVANSGNTTHPVGEKRANAWGLHDCHGNVFEWCADWFGEYRANPWPGQFRWTRDPHGPSSGPGHVLRGGSWCYFPPDPRGCRSAGRPDITPWPRLGNIGFRVAVAVAGP